jgi:hypothetical protein
MPCAKLNPTDKERGLVKSMAAFGIAQEDIAKQIGIKSPKTLRKYFRQELDRGAAEANYTVAAALYKRAKKGNVDAAKFWLKSRAGWREYPSFTPAAASPPPCIVAKDEGGDQQ